jgi:hypothetical protein
MFVHWLTSKFGQYVQTYISCNKKRMLTKENILFSIYKKNPKMIGKNKYLYKWWIQ